jgi:hypothetical protein
LNKEGHLCTTQWADGYNPSVHRKYPRRPPSVSWSATESNGTPSSLDASPTGLGHTTGPLSLRSNPPVIQEDFSIGQSKYLDFSINGLLNEKDAQPLPGLLDQSYSYVQSNGRLGEEASRIANSFSPAAKSLEMDYLQSLLPTKVTLLKIIDYYSDYMIYWNGGIYHWPTFRKKLVGAYGSSSSLNLKTLDWRWTALLFAILSSGIIGSPESTSVSWGFSIDDKVRLSRDWVRNIHIRMKVCSRR